MDCCDFTIYDMIARNAVLYPEKTALVYDDKRLSFSDYKKQCDQCATGLIAEGIGRGHRIAIISGNCDQFMILCGAVAKIGAIVVPLNWRLNEEEIAYMLNDCKPTHLFISKECQDLSTKASLKTKSVRKRYIFNPDGGGGDCIPFKELCLQEESEQERTIIPPPGDASYMIIYTAAVGGNPRGCLLSQSNMVATGLQLVHLLNLDRRDCHICILPLFHIGGFSMTMATMHQGGKNVILDHFDPLLVVNLIEKERGTFFGTFPPILASIVDAQEKGSCDLSSLRGVGGMDSPETIDRFLKNNPHAVFYSLFGQTEAMPVSGCDFMEKPGSIGPPVIQTRVALFDDFDTEVSPGAPGEICVRSPAVFQGYWNLEKDTAYAFRNGWHHTGDIGRIDEDGFLWYAGRKPEKELIKPGGENVYPVEVEKVILSHGSIREVCVIGVPDPEWGEAVKAICVLERGCGMRAEELIDFVASKIARYKKPKHVLFVEDLPKAGDGTIDREQVKKDYAGAD
ncbi:MAG: AMP-binding protein [Deltaproteobacteria bacterium]|nr:AMP-binding protein [Deltaproteobacteria bacterium]